jgi:hypothetical protein
VAVREALLKIIALLFAALLWLCTSSLAVAAQIGDEVPGHPGVTYFDLMKRVVTDLALDGEGGAVGHDVVPFEHIDGKNAKGYPPEAVTLQQVETMTIPGDDARIVLLADLGRSDGLVADAQLLALFALAPTPKLLDVVEVGTDRLTDFSEAKRVMLAPRTPLILIVNEHDNSDQSYQSYKMIFIRSDRFRQIDSVLAFGDATCSYRRTQAPSFSALPISGPYNALRVSVEERVKATGQDCGEEKPLSAHIATYQAIYRWDARRGRFITRSTQLDRLAKEDAKRM